MKPFVFKQASSIWPEGTSLLHVYALPSLDRDLGLSRLIGQCRAVTREFPLANVDSQWLHITIDQITDTTCGNINQTERDALRDAISQAVQPLEPFHVTAGSALSYHSGVIFDLHPDGGLTGLHQAVRHAIRAVRGENAVQYPWGVPHLTLSYATHEADSDLVQRALRRVRPSHAGMFIDRVHLVDVTADAQAKSLTWQSIAEIPLGSPQ